MIFLTVGSQFPFDRLVRSVDQAIAWGLIKDEVFGQIGNGSYTPGNFKATDALEPAEYTSLFERSDAVIGHAGMGTIALALNMRKPLLAMPRLSQYGEVVNDHQIALCQKFSQLGLILPAFKEDELFVQAARLKYFVPGKRICNPLDVYARIQSFLNQMNHPGR